MGEGKGEKREGEDIARGGDDEVGKVHVGEEGTKEVLGEKNDVWREEKGGGGGRRGGEEGGGGGGGGGRGGGVEEGKEGRWRRRGKKRCEKGSGGERCAVTIGEEGIRKGSLNGVGRRSLLVSRQKTAAMT